jgi:Helix-hairpin-helix domain
MLKVPSVQGSFDHQGTTRTTFPGAHEAAIWQAHIRRQGHTPRVERPESGLDPGNYWANIPDVSSEYMRLIRIYGADLVTRTYPTEMDMREVIDKELAKVARAGGINPSAPQEIKADETLIHLLTQAGFKDPTEKQIAAATKRNADAPETVADVAIELARGGFCDVNDIAGASLSSLCSLKYLGPKSAQKLIEAAKDLCAKNAASDKDKTTKGVDLGALAGRAPLDE